VSGAPRLGVSPASGNAGTTFTVHFTAPAAAGDGQGQIHAYTLSASARRATRGCIARVSMAPRPRRAGQAVGVALRPASLGGRWCRTTYSGKVTETIRAACGPPIGATGMRAAIICPQFVIVRQIGRFAFRVS
jgi:hypothetical protein